MDIIASFSSIAQLCATGWTALPKAIILAKNHEAKKIGGVLHLSCLLAKRIIQIYFTSRKKQAVLEEAWELPEPLQPSCLASCCHLFSPFVALALLLHLNEPLAGRLFTCLESGDRGQKTRSVLRLPIKGTRAHDVGGAQLSRC